MPVGIGIVTNGILISGSFLEFAEKYNIRISVSYDGLRNDDNRLTEDGCALLDVNQLSDAITKHNLFYQCLPKWDGNDNRGVSTADSLSAVAVKKNL